MNICLLGTGMTNHVTSDLLSRESGYTIPNKHVASITVGIVIMRYTYFGNKGMATQYRGQR